MADGTKIEWTDATWNPVTGCSVVSPGCTNCYAMTLAGTRLRHIASRAGLTRDSKAGPVWTGEVRLNEEWLTQPLRWRAPRMVFVCAHGDLFHASVPDEWIDRVFAVMALAPQHVFQVLTKRARRMREYLSGDRDGRVARACVDLWTDGAVKPTADWPVESIGDIDMPDDLKMRCWPLSHVWLGVSVEDQARANERIPELLETPAAVRWVSAEPLLGPVDFREIAVDGVLTVDALTGIHSDDENGPITGVVGSPDPHIDWIVVGGESGPGARPMQVGWARAIVEQCKASGTKCFMKQLGADPVWEDGAFLNLRDRKGGDPSEWPADLRIQQLPWRAVGDIRRARTALECE